MPKPAELAGIKFGLLTPIETVPHDVTGRRGGRDWLCQCECGNATVVRANSLLRGLTKSCGCLRKKLSAERRKTHGESGSPTYKSWQRMKQRCESPDNKHYYCYGGRGISVCERWSCFENFLADMGQCPVGYSIERIDVNGDYCPQNCKWIPKGDQSKNRRPSSEWVFKSRL